MKAEYYVTCAGTFCHKADKPMTTPSKGADIEENAASNHLGNGASLRRYFKNGLVSCHLTASVNAL